MLGHVVAFGHIKIYENRGKAAKGTAGPGLAEAPGLDWQKLSARPRLFGEQSRAEQRTFE
jgi:hypothetical protein